MTIKDQLIKLSAVLKRVSEVPQLEAEILVSFCTGKSKEFPFIHPEYELSEKEIRKLKSLLTRRLNYEPIAYITGKKEFFGHEFKVDKHVLIPRPETEMLVELAIKEIKAVKEPGSSAKNKKITVHELATGSGAVIISIAKEIESTASAYSFSASDISEKALSIAKSNAKNILTIPQIKLKKLDILKVKALAKADIIIANPPYIPTAKIRLLKPEVRNFEPVKALDGGGNGMEFYQAILELFAKNPSKALILELESENSKEIFQLAEKLLPSARKKLYKDLSKKDRVLLISLA